MMISAEDRERISKAIHAVEARTSGEIICVLARTSSAATALPIIFAAVAALALPWFLVAFTAMTVHRILSLQIVVFVVLVLVFYVPRVRLALMPRKARRVAAHHVAMEQFTMRVAGRTSDRCGILIFVSFAERYARIIVDDGIAARVGQSEWQAALNALLAHMSHGRIAEGFMTAIDLCGNELARHFPRTEKCRDELPNRIYLI
jgi:putative membrane protein